MTAPLLVLAVGNRSRGDDALGPLLLDRLRAADAELSGAVELIEDFQLQVEHALDVQGREAVLFVDASRLPVEGGARLSEVCAARHADITTHALTPPAVLDVYERVTGLSAPPSAVLAISGTDFELGRGPGCTALGHLERAVALAWAWIGSRNVPGLAAQTPG